MRWRIHVLLQDNGGQHLRSIDGVRLTGVPQRDSTYLAVQTRVRSELTAELIGGAWVTRGLPRGYLQVAARARIARGAVVVWLELASLCCEMVVDESMDDCGHLWMHSGWSQLNSHTA